jgi:hypothetical protein
MPGIGLGYRSGGVPEPDPQAEDWWQGTAYPALRGIRDHLLGNPLEAASMSSVPVVSDVADMSLAGRDLYRFATEPSRDTALDAGLSLAGAALPFVGVGALKGARNFGMGGRHAAERTAFSTHEAVPYAESGHLEGIVAASPAARRAYSADPSVSWQDAQGQDILHTTLGDRSLPTQQGTGVYTPPQGGLETNPLRIARTPVPLEGGALPAAAEQRLNAANAVRGYLDVQGADPWHMPLFGAPPADATGLFVPYGRGLDPAEAKALSAAVGEHGYWVADTGHGVSILPPPGKTRADLDMARKAGLDSVIRRVLPKSEAPLPAQFKSGYPTYEQAFKAGNTGQGKATATLRSYLQPEQIERLDASREIRDRVLRKLEVDEKAVARLGPNATARSDIQRARWLIAHKGFKGLFEALDAGDWLPAAGVLAPVLGAAGLAQSEDPQT